MRKTEICRAIAERMEPEVVFDDCYGISRGGYWTLVLNPMGNKAEPFYPFTSESANALLLDSMPRYSQVKTSDGCNMMIYANGMPHWTGPKPDRKTAVVLATCKWLGIEVGEIDG